MMELPAIGKNMPQPVLPPVEPFDRTKPGKRARFLRLRLGAQIKTVAEATGIGASQISRLENGKVRLFLDQAVLLARAYGVGLDELAGLGADDA